MTLTLMMASGSFSLADGINSDGDNIDASVNVHYDSTHRACADRGSAVSGDVRFNRSGNNHFTPGVAISISATPSALAAAQGITASGGTATIPNDGSYDANGESYNAVGVLSTTVPATAANGTYQVTVTATQGASTESNPYNVIIDCAAAPANTAPVIAFTTSHTSANEGDTKTFNFSITDTSTDTHSYVTGYPDCGTGNTLESSSINNTAHTGTFQCKFPDGLVPAVASSVMVKVQDNGSPSLQSNQLTAGVTVSNVNPTVAQPSFNPASVDCRNSATLTGISFSDPGVNDADWNVNINWGDGSTDTNYDASTQGAQSNRTHQYDTPGSYTATVTVTDKDGGQGSNTSSNQLVVNQTYAVDFLPPFDDSTPSGLIVNKMKTGRVVPVKVTLFDECSLSSVTDPNTDVTIKITKTSGTGGTADPVEEYADAGESSAGTDEFRPADGFWIYNLDNKALGLVVNNYYRIDVYVGAVKATVDNWGVLQPVK